LDLTLGVTLAVLGAALLHATWNAMVKSSRDIQLDLTIITFGAGVAAPAVPVLRCAAGARRRGPYLAATIVIHVGYYIAIVGAYRAGDLSHGYPIMRGVAPLLVALSAAAWFGEAPRPNVWLGILLICGGVLSLWTRGFPLARVARLDRLGAQPMR
jgi:multidrug transporter EmrE-like cation transporter